MKKILLKMILLSFLPSFSQTNYYPIDIGYYWKYKGAYLFKDDIYWIIAMDTLTIKSNTYYKMLYKVDSPAYGNSQEIKYIRKDSLGNVIDYDIKSHSESIMYRLSNIPDTLAIIHCDSLNIQCYNDFLDSGYNLNLDDFWWGKISLVRVISNGARQNKYFVDKIGLCGWWDDNFGPTFYLTDCFIKDTLYSNVNEDNNIRNQFSLYIYPNPFNASTMITFSITKNTNYSIHIYNILGRLIDSIQNTNATIGINHFKWSPSNYSSGIYFVSIIVDGQIFTRKLVYNK
jgi:hypothetical protein